jgi:2-keto-4-pentenoate hydratase/2-oxohepta-3-ene-1,7-dioic acid hydratase in catechol pathway
MKLIRHGLAGQEKPGVILEDGTRVDVSRLTPDYDEDFFAGEGPERLASSLQEGSAPLIPEDSRLGPPVRRPSKIVCVGLNFFDHAAESKMQVPDEPVLFMKASSALSGPFDDILLPRGSEKTDWEVELAFVIGRTARYVEESDALDHVAGYSVLNDVSERSYQIERGGQWVKGKSCDTFAPLGPQLVTPDEIDDVHDLRMWLSVNGTTVQDSSTAKMVFKVPQLLSYISRFMTLLPGDVVCTGTPAGVGLGMVPPQYLKAGDVVELGIDKIGVMRQTVVAANT